MCVCPRHVYVQRQGTINFTRKRPESSLNTSVGAQTSNVESKGLGFRGLRGLRGLGLKGLGVRISVSGV